MKPNADVSTPIRSLAVMGATATGKSELAVALALEFGGEIVSMDSRQVYRGFDIGTGKVDAATRARVPHHLIDILDPAEPGSAGRHAALAEHCLREIAARRRVPVLAGGTGLYFRALFRGLVNVTIPRERLADLRAAFAGRGTADLHAELASLDPERAASLSPNDRVRVTRALELIGYTGVRASELYAHEPAHPGRADIVYLKIVLTLPRAALHERVASRTRALFAAGWPGEVARLLAAGVSPEAPAMNSLGYAEIAAALHSGGVPPECLDRVIAATRQYAKRQETFFRSERDAVWVDVTRAAWRDETRRLVAAFLKREASQ